MRSARTGQARAARSWTPTQNVGLPRSPEADAIAAPTASCRASDSADRNARLHGKGDQVVLAQRRGAGGRRRWGDRRPRGRRVAGRRTCDGRGAAPRAARPRRGHYGLTSPSLHNALRNPTRCRANTRAPRRGGGNRCAGEPRRSRLLGGEGQRANGGRGWDTRRDGGSGSPAPWGSPPCAPSPSSRTVSITGPTAPCPSRGSCATSGETVSAARSGEPSSRRRCFLPTGNAARWGRSPRCFPSRLVPSARPLIPRGGAPMAPTEYLQQPKRPLLHFTILRFASSHRFGSFHVAPRFRLSDGLSFRSP